MTPEFPTDPRQAFEVSLTAMLLGELPEDQAAFLRQAIAQDAELKRTYERLKQTIELVGEIEKSPAVEPAPEREPLRLSDQKRQELLQSFKTVPLRAVAEEPRRRMRWLVPAAAAAVLLLFAGSALLPALSRAKSRSLGYAYQRLAPQDAASAPAASAVNEAVVRHALQPKPVQQREVLRQMLARGDADRAGVPQAGAKVAELGKATIVLPQNAEADQDAAASALGMDRAPTPASVAFQNPSVAVPQLGQQIGRDMFSLADVAVKPETATPTAGVSYGGGGGFGGGDTHAAPPAERAPEEAFYKRYGLRGRAAAPQIQTESKDKAEAGVTLGAVDPNTGLPVSGSPNLGVDPNTGLPIAAWSVNADLRGFVEGGIATNAAPRGYFPGTSPVTKPQPTLANDSLAMAGGLALSPGAPVPQEPAYGMYNQKTPMLGDEPTAGRYFWSDDSKSALNYGAVTESLARTAGKTPKSDADEVAQYDAAKRELAEAQRRRQFLVMKSLAEGVEGKAVGSENLEDRRRQRQEGTDQLKAAIEQQEKKVQLSQQKVDELGGRLQLRGTVSIEGTPAVLVDSDTLGRRLDDYRVEVGNELAREKQSLERAKKLKPEELAQALPGTGVPDQLLGALLEQLNRAQQQLYSLKNEGSPDTSKLSRTQEQVAELQQRVQARVAGSMANLQARVDSLEKDLEDFDAKIAKQTNSQAPRTVETPSTDTAPAKPATPPPVPQPEIQTSENAFSTFSLNISDVSFKLAAASLEKGAMPEAASIRSEEFINAFDYRDPEAPAGVPIAFAWERARYPFAQNRDLLRFSLKTAAQGRQPGRPLNLVLLLDNSGSMERADRVQIIREALRVLAGQLQPQDRLSIITFARTARLWVDGVPGNQAAQVLEQVAGLTPQGGTNLEEAMNLGYQTALRHYQANGINRVVLLTDGAANLGNVEPESLKKKVEGHRKQGVALDCFGIGWEGYNDDLLEVLSRNGDGRYGFINTPEEAATEFAGKLAGALHVAASDVKAQVEFNPGRVTAYRQIGYAQHQLTKEQFRDNTVDAAEIGAAESGNALYVVEVNPGGKGPLAMVRVRYKVPGTAEYHEHEWAVPYTGNAIALPDSTPAIRLAATAIAFSEWLAGSPYAAEVAPDNLLECLRGIPEIYGADQRPKKLEWMIRQAKSLIGK